MAKSNVTPRGFVVDHKGNGMRYAVSVGNYNPKIHKKVRDLRPGETVLGYRPKSRCPLTEPETETPSTEGNEE